MGHMRRPKGMVNAVKTTEDMTHNTSKAKSIELQSVNERSADISLPTITNKKVTSSIDVDDANDDEMPQKPRNIDRRTSNGESSGGEQSVVLKSVTKTR